MPSAQARCGRGFKIRKRSILRVGTFGGTVEEQADFVNKMAAEVDAVVVLTCQLAAEGEGEDVWKSNVERLLELTGDAPLGMYECPAPYLRLLSPSRVLA